MPRFALPALVFAALLSALVLGCGDGGTTVIVSDTGATGADTTGGQGAVCQPGRFFCNGSTGWTCRRDGSGYDLQECPGGCGATACTSQVCVPGEARCVSSRSLRTCKADGSGYELKTCAVQCQNNGCSETADCVPGDRTCANSRTLVTCGDTPETSTVESCTFGCAEGACQDAPCQVGDVRCNPATGKGKEVQICRTDQRGWRSNGTVCTELCEEGKCVTTRCEPNSTFCDGDARRTCNADGSGVESEEECEFGCSFPSAQIGPVCNKCREGQVACQGDTTVMACEPISGMQPIDECRGNERCADGNCLEVVSFDAGVSQDEALMRFTEHAVYCWLTGVASDTSQTCWILDTTNLTNAFDEDDLQNWFCDKLEDGTFTAESFEAFRGFSAAQIYNGAEDLYGCGFFDLLDVTVSVPEGRVQPGVGPVNYCIHFAASIQGQLFVRTCNDPNR